MKMVLILRCSAFAAIFSTVSGYVLGQMPSQTIGIGLPIFEILPTAGPSLELVKKSLEKKAVTNTCSQWTISSGDGFKPICDFSETCLFTSATDGNLYEGCGQTSIAYNWITRCFDYNVMSGLPPVSQLYCPSTAPFCGQFVFVYDSAHSFYNFGCSGSSYSTTAFLVSAGNLDGGGTTKISPSTVTVTKGPDPTTTGDPSNANTSLPTINSNGKKKKPLGAIIGGAVGGIAVIIIAAFLAWFFCYRKRKQNKQVNQTSFVQQQQEQHQQEADAATTMAYHNPNRLSEMGGDPKAPTVFPPGSGYVGQGGAYNGPEKPVGNSNVQEFYRPPPNTYGSELGTETAGSQSPPPVYAQPPNSPPVSTYPPSNYTELDNSARQSMPPVSPVGTYSNIASHNSVGSVSELGGTSRMSYQPYNPPVPEMSAVAPAVQRTRQSGVDMSGAPLHETYQPHEMA